MSNTLFRKASLDSISSPEQLNDYIKVSNPSVWATLIALFILLAAVLVWSITGSLPTTVSTGGVIYGGDVLCYLDTESAAAVKAGQEVKIKARAQDSIISGHVSAVGTVPMSASEIAVELKSDYLVRELAKKEYAVKVTVALDSLSDVPDGTMADLSVVTDATKPIDFLLN